MFDKKKLVPRSCLSAQVKLMLLKSRGEVGNTIYSQIYLKLMTLYQKELLYPKASSSPCFHFSMIIKYTKASTELELKCCFGIFA